MLLIPAIDLKDGRCVRLKQGDMNDSTVFSENPAAMARRWIVGSPDQARARIEELAAEHGVTEVMVQPVAGAAAGTDVRTSPAREETLRLLAG